MLIKKYNNWILIKEEFRTISYIQFKTGVLTYETVVFKAYSRVISSKVYCKIRVCNCLAKYSEDFDTVLKSIREIGIAFGNSLGFFSNIHVEFGDNVN